ncbi:hypothetical protein PENFLA_c003G00174 [Penicillium flavigenum]|uniref:Uncharacterized protein n=1 Tax=Penicillium flavigenum TaxID=254877 RepID=A0A1V6TVM1_9EURO|nr:hypothetical protein PENFLA_c003G00174 [Penicillium flavigenum]
MRDNRSCFLGHVAAGSGVYWIQKNDAEQATSMDWALIDIALGRLQRQMHGDEVEGNRNHFTQRILFQPSAAGSSEDKALQDRALLWNNFWPVQRPDVGRYLSTESERWRVRKDNYVGAFSVQFHFPGICREGGFWFMGVYGVRRRLRDVDHRRRTEGNSEHMLHI